MGSLASSNLSTKDIEDEGRFLFGTGTTASTTGTDLTITGWETTAIVSVLFVIALVAWVVLLSLPTEAAATAYAATGYETDPYAAHEFAPQTGFASGHHAAPTGGHHSSYSSVARSLEAAARKYL